MPGKIELRAGQGFAEAFLRGQPHKVAIATTLHQGPGRQAPPVSATGAPDGAAAAGAAAIATLRILPLPARRRGKRPMTDLRGCFWIQGCSSDLGRV